MATPSMRRVDSESSLASSSSASSSSSPPSYCTIPGHIESPLASARSLGKLRPLPTPPTSAPQSASLNNTTIPPHTHSLNQRSSMSSMRSFRVRPLPATPSSSFHLEAFSDPAPSPAPSLTLPPEMMSSHASGRACRAQTSLPTISTTRLLPTAPSSTNVVSPIFSPLTPQAPSQEEVRAKNLSKLRRHLGKSVPADLIIKPIVDEDESDEDMGQEWARGSSYDWNAEGEGGHRSRELPPLPKLRADGARGTPSPASPPVFAVMDPNGQPLQDTSLHQHTLSFSASASESSFSLSSTSSSSTSSTPYEPKLAEDANGPAKRSTLKPLAHMVPAVPFHAKSSRAMSEEELKKARASRMWLREIRGERKVEENYDDILKALRALH